MKRMFVKALSLCLSVAVLVMAFGCLGRGGGKRGGGLRGGRPWEGAGPN